MRKVTKKRAQRDTQKEFVCKADLAEKLDKDQDVENLEDENKTLNTDKVGAMANEIGTEDDANGDQGKDHTG